MHTIRCWILTGVAVLLGCVMQTASADPKADYERRSAERYAGLFKSLDLNGDGAVTRVEAQGDVNFAPRFDDMDINRDGAVTAAELQRYIELQFNVRVEFSRP